MKFLLLLFILYFNFFYFCLSALFRLESNSGVYFKVELLLVSIIAWPPLLLMAYALVCKIKYNIRVLIAMIKLIIKFISESAILKTA